MSVRFSVLGLGLDLLGLAEILGARLATRGRDTVKRKVREEQEKNMDTLLYGPMDEMRRKQLL